MPLSFSKDLIAKMKTYAHEKFGQELTDETADQYLGSLARVYLAFAEIERKRKSPRKLNSEGFSNNGLPKT